MYIMHIYYTYSFHVLDRMKERQISANEIEMLLSNDVDVIKLPSEKDKNIELILGFVFGKGIVLIVNTKTKNIVTVRRMRKKEKELFGRIENED